MRAERHQKANGWGLRTVRAAEIYLNNFPQDWHADFFLIICWCHGHLWWYQPKPADIEVSKVADYFQWSTGWKLGGVLQEFMENWPTQIHCLATQYDTDNLQMDMIKYTYIEINILYTQCVMYMQYSQCSKVDLVAHCRPDVQARSEFLRPHLTKFVLISFYLSPTYCWSLPAELWCSDFLVCNWKTK